MSRTTPFHGLAHWHRLAAWLALGILGSGLLAAQPDASPRFRQVWKSELHVAEIALDPLPIRRGALRSRLWALRVSPPAFLRLGQQGQVVEEVAFAAPRQLHLGSSFRPLAVLARGFALSEYTFDRRGKAVRPLPFNQALDLATGPGDEVLGLDHSGLWSFDEHGATVLHVEPTALALTSSHELDHVAAGATRVAVASKRRIWLLDSHGKEIHRADLPAAEESARIYDLDLDGQGRLYVATTNPPLLRLFDSELRPEGAREIYAERLAVNPDGSFYALSGRRLSFYEPVTDEARRVRTPRIESVTISARAGSRRSAPSTGSDHVGPGVARFHTRSAPVRAVAADPASSGVVWIATRGGVVRVDPSRQGQSRFRKWTAIEGLPGNDVMGIAFDPKGRLFAVTQHDGIARLDSGRERFTAVASGRVANVERIVHDGSRPEGVWIDAGNRLYWFDFQTGRASEELEIRGLRDVVPLPSGLGLLTHEDLRWWPRNAAIRILTRFDEMAQQPGYETLRLTSPIQPSRLSFVDGEWWIGDSDRNGFLIYDPDSGTWRQPEWNPLMAAMCDAPWIAEHAGRRFVVSRWCLGEIVGGEWRVLREDLRTYAVLPEAVLPEAVLPEDGGSGRLWVGTRGGLGLFESDPERLTATVRWYRPDDEPGGNRPEVVQAAFGKIWTGFTEDDQGFSVLEPESGRWWTFPRIRADHIVAVGDEVLVQGGNWRCRTGPEAHWVDPLTVTVLRRDCSLERLFQWRVEGLVHDGRAFWALGESRQQEEWILGRITADSVASWRLGKGPRSDRRPLVQDPEDDRYLWFLAGDELRRFDKEQGTWEGVHEGTRAVYPFDERYLWLDASTGGLLDRESFEWIPIESDERMVPDSEDPGIGWTLDEGKLCSIEVPTPRRLRCWPLPVEVLSGGVEVLEHVLLVHELTCFVPRIARQRQASSAIGITMLSSNLRTQLRVGQAVMPSSA